MKSWRLFSLAIANNTPAAIHLDRNARDGRFDLAKAICIVFVLLWHVKPLPEYWPAIAFFYNQISLVAVPSFILVALVIFGLKRLHDFAYFNKRTLKIARLFMLWGLVQCGIAGLTIGSGLFPDYTPSFAFGSFIRLLINGGPPLPGVSGSVFYFLLALLMVTVLFEIYCRLPGFLRGSAAVIIVCCTVLICCSPSPPAYYSVANFIIYVPAAHWLLYHKPGRKFSLMCGLLLAAYVAAVLNPSFNGQGTYARFSIISGSLFLVIAAMSLKMRKLNPLISWLGKHSFWIYSTHKYFQLAVIIVFAFLERAGAMALETGSAVRSLTIFFIVISLTFLSVVPARRNALVRRYFT